MKQHEIALSRQDHLRHILVERHDPPHGDGIAVAICGVVAWYSPTKWVEEKAMCLNREKIKMCAGCMRELQHRSMVKHDQTHSKWREKQWLYAHERAEWARKLRFSDTNRWSVLAEPPPHMGLILVGPLDMPLP